MREMRDTLRAAFGRALGLENRRRVPRAGQLEHIRGFQSKILDNAREITIYLPPGYERGDGPYPVLYMQDGQNLFEPERAFIAGQSWKLAEAADQAINERTARPMIIVGVDHAGPERIEEYTPTYDPSRQAGGRAGDYAQMLVEELKPLIDARYRTIPADTGAGGSSLGGLVSLHLGLTRPNIFTRLAVMSPSVWWNNRAIVQAVDKFDGPRTRIWLDVGGREGRDTLRDARTLRDRLQKRGWTDADLAFNEDPRGDHSERAWARRARKMLEFLYPPTASP
jgi:predicted alpha/beta superfamily hydrolase